MKHIFAAIAFIALGYFVFFSDMSRSAWNGRCGNRPCGERVTQDRLTIPLTPTPSESAITRASGARRRMRDSEVTACWARGATKVFRDYHATASLGDTFAIDCPEGRAVGTFEVHSNATKGVSLFWP